MKTTVFFNNKTQAVRVPSALRFPKGIKSVDIRRVGNELILSTNDPWADFFDKAPLADDDKITRSNDVLLDDRASLK
jgi:antitoxin VapB